MPSLTSVNVAFQPKKLPPWLHEDGAMEGSSFSSTEDVVGRGIG
jgi:hypothetical protein